jgi:hypothetical protein
MGNRESTSSKKDKKKKKKKTKMGDVNKVIEFDSQDLSPEALGRYDVFLNHRGPDVKRSFVSHLYNVLCEHGCNPFLDAKSLIKGNHALNSINEALHGVRMHLAVFSKGYAKSKYCLNELCDMMKSPEKVIPVFFKALSLGIFVGLKADPLLRLLKNTWKKNETRMSRGGRMPYWKLLILQDFDIPNTRKHHMDLYKC